MFSALNIVTIVITIGVIVGLAYFVKKRLDSGKDLFPFLDNGDYCDYCGSKLIENPIGSTPWNSVRQACPKCGYDCKKPNTA